VGGQIGAVEFVFGIEADADEGFQLAINDQAAAVGAGSKLGWSAFLLRSFESPCRQRRLSTRLPRLLKNFMHSESHHPPVCPCPLRIGLANPT
jgi:hypothetical protein